MPLSVRVINPAMVYSHEDILNEATLDTVLEDTNMSVMLGCLHQIAYLSSYSLELFESLTYLTHDISERIDVATLQTNNLRNKLLPDAERRAKMMDIGFGHSGLKSKERYLNDRNPYVPAVLTRDSAPNEIMTLYENCAPSPSFSFLPKQIRTICSNRFSNPGKES